MNTNEMLQALFFSANENCAHIAKQCLLDKSEIIRQNKICGSFMKLVFAGDYKKAFLKADGHNKIAFLAFLISRNRLEEYTDLVLSIDQLIKFTD